MKIKPYCNGWRGKFLPVNRKWEKIQQKCENKDENTNLGSVLLGSGELMAKIC